ERPNFHSTELYLLLYIVNLVGIMRLRQHKELFIYCLVFFVFTLFIFNYELPRYLLPLAPFAILVGFARFLSARYVRWYVFLLYLYLAYTFVWGFLPLAVCPMQIFQKLIQ